MFRHLIVSGHARVLGVSGPDGSRWHEQTMTRARAKWLRLLSAATAGQNVPPWVTQAMDLDSAAAKVQFTDAARTASGYLIPNSAVLAHAIVESRGPAGVVTGRDAWIGVPNLREPPMLYLPGRRGYGARRPADAIEARLLDELRATGDRDALVVYLDLVMEHGVNPPPLAAWRTRNVSP